MQLHHNFRYDNPERGFTLLEVIVVLGIFTLIIAASSIYMSGIGPEKSMRENAVALESLAREAQTRAIMSHETNRIVITNDEFILLHGEQYTQDPKEWRILPNRRKVEISDPDLKISVYRWGSPIKHYPSRDMPMVWVFPPEGFVEPISIQFDIDTSYLRQTYHPLTASVGDEEMEIQ